jgi:hypothetical protein
MNTQTNEGHYCPKIPNPRNWIRLVYMLIFALLLHLAGIVMWVLCSLQFLFAFFTGKDNDNLRSLGASIAAFVHQALDFVSYNTEQKPFPFAAWPGNPRSTDNDVIIEAEEVDGDSGENAEKNA